MKAMPAGEILSGWDASSSQSPTCGSARHRPRDVAWAAAPYGPKALVCTRKSTSSRNDGDRMLSDRCVTLEFLPQCLRAAHA
ncbi:MAG: hypothetical protein ACK55Z_33430, partial [bacterium]